MTELIKAKKKISPPNTKDALGMRPQANAATNILSMGSGFAMVTP